MVRDGILKQRALSRRTLLRGLGVSIGLPFLDAMQPAFAASEQIREHPCLGIVYVPNGMFMPAWMPTEGDSPVNLSQTLQPLTPFRSRCTILSGVSLEPADRSSSAGGPHSLACTGFLTGEAPLPGDGQLRAGISLDQKAAQLSGANTWLPSIELACEEQVSGIDRESGYSTAYMNHLSWRTSYTPMPAETNPAEAFKRLFRSGGSLWASPGSVLDGIRADAKSLAASLGSGDRSRLADYLGSLRELELRVHNAVDVSQREASLLMMDIVALAFETGRTRVATVMLGREKSSQTFPELGIVETHHQLSHGNRDQATIQKLSAIDHYHTELFAHLVRRLDSMKAAQGSVLDSSILLYGSGLSDGSRHRHDNLPLLIAGGFSSGNESGAHSRLASCRKMTEVHDSILGDFAGRERSGR